MNGVSGTQLEYGATVGNFPNGGVTLIRSVSKFSFPGTGSIESKSDNGAASFERYTFDELIRTQGIGGSFATTLVLARSYNSNGFSRTIKDTLSSQCNSMPDRLSISMGRKARSS